MDIFSAPHFHDDDAARAFLERVLWRMARSARTAARSTTPTRRSGRAFIAAPRRRAARTSPSP